MLALVKFWPEGLALAKKKKRSCHIISTLPGSTKSMVNICVDCWEQSRTLLG